MVQVLWNSAFNGVIKKLMTQEDLFLYLMYTAEFHRELVNGWRSQNVSKKRFVFSISQLLSIGPSQLLCRPHIIHGVLWGLDTKLVMI